MTLYATAAEVRAQIQKASPADDTVIEALLASVCAAIDGICNRPDGFAAAALATARLYAGRGAATLRVDDCVEITAVAAKLSTTDAAYTAWAASDWIAFTGDPKHPNFNRKPYTGLMAAPGGAYRVFLSGRYAGTPGFPPDEDNGPSEVPTVQVTARWGSAETCPANVKEAAIIMTARHYKRGQSAWADVTGNPDMGGILLYRRMIDPDVEALLHAARLIRPSIG